MKVSIFGLGYVGSVSAACFAKAGHDVIGVDVSQLKVDIIKNGRSPIVEPGLDDLIADAVKHQKLRATTSATEAVHASDVSLVCVGTPGRPNGSLDLTHLKRVCQQIGEALQTKERHHIVTVRSTMLPGSMHDVIVPTLEVYSNKRCGVDFSVGLNPEFLREGSSINDFEHPPFTLLGVEDQEVAGVLSRLYTKIDAPLLVAGIEEAEMVKYACNCFHALKVVFANEIGAICERLGVDGKLVMDILCKDTKLNLSSCYLKPGFAFGGSCLPKDLAAITYKARTLDAEVPMLNSILASNRHQIERAVNAVLCTGKKCVGVLGMSFKAGTDDLRESPMVTMIEALLGKGLKLSIHDRDVNLARLHGANKEYIERGIPHISSLMRSDVDDVLRGAEVLVLGKMDEAYRDVVSRLPAGCVVLDLVGVTSS